MIYGSHQQFYIKSLTRWKKVSQTWALKLVSEMSSRIKGLLSPPKKAQVGKCCIYRNYDNGSRQLQNQSELHTHAVGCSCEFISVNRSNSRLTDTLNVLHKLSLTFDPSLPLETLPVRVTSMLGLASNYHIAFSPYRQTDSDIGATAETGALLVMSWRKGHCLIPQATVGKTKSQEEPTGNSGAVWMVNIEMGVLLWLVMYCGA